MRAVGMRCLILGIILLASQAAGVSGARASASDEADRLFAEAMAHWDRSTSPEVETLLRQALALQRSALPPADPRIARTVDQLGRVFYNRGVETADRRQFEEAATWFREAAGLLQQAANPDRLSLGDYVSDLAAGEREAGRPRSALPIVCEGLSIRLSLEPPRVDRIGASLNNMARAFAALGDRREAGALLRDVRAIEIAPGNGPSIGMAAYDRNCRGAPVS